MTVRELMIALSHMNPDATVVFPNTYAREECWHEGHEEATEPVTTVVTDKYGRCLLHFSNLEEYYEPLIEEDG